MDVRPHVWGTWDDEHCTLRMDDFAFGGTLAWPDDDIPPSSAWTLAFGGLDITHLAHDINFGGIGFDGDDGLMEE
jgi:hypothetical protein